MNLKWMQRMLLVHYAHAVAKRMKHEWAQIPLPQWSARHCEMTPEQMVMALRSATAAHRLGYAKPGITHPTFVGDTISHTSANRRLVWRVFIEEEGQHAHLSVMFQRHSGVALSFHFSRCVDDDDIPYIHCEVRRYSDVPLYARHLNEARDHLLQFLAAFQEASQLQYSAMGTDTCDPGDLYQIANLLIARAVDPSSLLDEQKEIRDQLRAHLQQVKGMPVKYLDYLMAAALSDD